MRFPPEFIDRLRERITLSEVVGKRVILKRHGREYQGLCPFHHEKSPSFTVNDAKGFYHCFGCGAHGDAIRFLTENEGLGYKEAIERLAGEIGMPLPKLSHEQQATVRRSAGLQEIMEAATAWYEQQLQIAAGRNARDYLRERGLHDATIRHFRIGFAPDSRDGLRNYLMTQGVKETQLIEAGLCIRPDSGASYDRFRGRVMFPIMDRNGKVIAFGGRIMQTGPGIAKYLNSPDTPLFHKGEILYAFDKARQAAHKAGNVLVAEGYMDVIALHQAGIHHAVAPLGTAITENHLRLLWQMADEPTLCLDGDSAGERAMMRAAELSLGLVKTGKALRFLMLPKGEDPDTLVKKTGTQGFLDLAKQAISLSDALWKHYAGDLRRAGPEKLAQVEQSLLQAAEKIQDPTLRNHFAAYFKSKLWEARSRTNKKQDNSKDASRSREVEQFMHLSAEDSSERDLIRLLLACPELMQFGEVEESLGCFTFRDPLCQKMRDILLQLSASGDVLSAEIFARHLTQNDMQSMLATSQRLAPQMTEAAALHQWRTRLTLIQLRSEFLRLEQDLTENISETAYNRFVTIKKEIATLEKEARLVE